MCAGVVYINSIISVNDATPRRQDAGASIRGEKRDERRERREEIREKKARIEEKRQAMRVIVPGEDVGADQCECLRCDEHQRL